MTNNTDNADKIAVLLDAERNIRAASVSLAAAGYRIHDRHEDNAGALADAIAADRRALCEIDGQSFVSLEK